MVATSCPDTRFILYSRSYCHLCDDLLQALRHLVGAGIPVDVIDIDFAADPELLARYDELVPVLMGCKQGSEPEQLCHYFLNENIILNFLATAAA